MESVRRIAILMGQDLSFCRNAIRGIRAYAIQKTEWVFRNGPPDPQVIHSLRDWRPHGIIANLVARDVARAVIRMRKPLVDTACMLPDLGVPVVDVDHIAVGRLAAEHLIDRGLHHFGFLGSEDAVYSKMREAGFREALATHGRTVSSCYGEFVHYVSAKVGWKKMDQKIGKWLQQLPKPVGILACNDTPARNLADMCRHFGLDIPNQVALLGVDDDDLECSLASPPLSSVAIPAERIGYEAAKLLDRMMSGQPASGEPIFLAPLRVVPRQSTDTMAVEDPRVVAALTLIRRRAAHEINVASLVKQIGGGRRELERRFRSVLGRSILEEIRYARIELAKELLLSTDLAMSDVAHQAGFSNAQRLAVVFGQVTGMSPTAFRRQAKIHQ